MPGASHMHAGKPITERSALGIVWMFFVFPIAVGGAFTTFIVVRTIASGRQFTTGQWLGEVIFCGLLGLGIMTCLPAAGWQELSRRRRVKREEG